jgi:hypothetical protein
MNISKMFVPIKAQAWIKNPNTISNKIIQQPPQYDKLHTFVDDVMPDPDPSASDTLKTRKIDSNEGNGVYLHWALPRGFRHGYTANSHNKGFKNSGSSANIFTIIPESVIDPNDLNNNLIYEGSVINNLIDGDKNTRWNPTHDRKPYYYAQFTLDQPHNIIGFNVSLTADNTHTARKIWVGPGALKSTSDPNITENAFTVPTPTPASNHVCTFTFELAKPFISKTVTLGFQSGDWQIWMYEVNFIVSNRIVYPQVPNRWLVSRRMIVDNLNTQLSDPYNISPGFVGSAEGYNWKSDTDYVNTNTTQSGFSQDPVAGTDTPALYNYERRGQMKYTFSVKSGSYLVILRFAENNKSLQRVGARVFHIEINGSRIETNFDIFQRAGERGNLAYQTTYQINSTDNINNNGKIIIDFITVTDNPKISAIQIITESTTNWIVESDTIINPVSGSATYCDVEHPNSEIRGTARCIGKKSLLSQWNETNTTNRVSLKIMQSGNLLFADYQPHCLNVFSIFDPIPDTVKNVSISYMIVGWYSQVTDDPLINSSIPHDTLNNMFITLQERFAIRVYPGNNIFIDSNKHAWRPDAFYITSQDTMSTLVNDYPAKIPNQSDRLLYRYERWTRSNIIKYNFPVENGFYLVVLTIIEATDLRAGRIFDIDINGLKVKSGLDVWSLIGDYKPYYLKIPIIVSTSLITLTLTKVTGDPHIHGIEILLQDSFRWLPSVEQNPDAYVDVDKNVWSPFGGITSSVTPVNCKNNISGTTDSKIYQTEISATQWSHQFSLPPGSYTVILKFTESQYSQSGQRIFDIIANGVTKISRLDIYAVSGGKNIAYDTAFRVQVSQNSPLSIQFIKTSGSSGGPPKLNAIQIVQTSRLFLQGTIYNINWVKDDPYVNTNMNTNPTLAIGSNSLEALSAVVESMDNTDINNKMTAEVFNAFIHGFLDKISDPDEYQEAVNHVYQTGFNSHAAGIEWKIVSKSTTNHDTPIKLNQTQTSQLDNLNLAQDVVNNLQRELKLRQWELFASWWKSKKYTNVNNTTLLNSSRQKVIDLNTSLKQKIGEVNEYLDRLKGSGIIPNSSDNGHTLKAVPSDRFWIRNDPALMITGCNTSQINDHYKSSPCRFKIDLVSRFKNIQYIQELTLRIGWVPQITLNDVDTDVLDAIKVLATEFAIMDPKNPSRSIQLGKSPIDPNTYTSESDNNVTYKVKGIVPIYGLEPWTGQPWYPLFILWKVDWYDVPFEKWQFGDVDVRSGTAGYKVSSITKSDGTDPSSNSNRQTLKGRTLITPHSKISFKAQLHKHIDPDNNDLVQSISDDIDKWDIISHPLSGFINQFVQKRNGLHITPQNASTGTQDQDDIKLMGKQYRLTPGQHASFDNDNTILPSFHSVAHGQFYFRDVQIVDRFGQRMSVTPSVARAPMLTPTAYPSSINTAIDKSKIVQIPPTILQESRINAYWITPDVSGSRLTFNSTKNPICGWVVVNYLDQAIQLYDSDSSILGELSVSNNIVNWTPLSIRDITSSNTYIYSLYRKMMKVGILSNMLEILNKYLDTRQISSHNTSGYTSAFSGRPLALTRAKWGIQLAQPKYKKFEDDSRNNPDLDTYKFPMKLGDPRLVTDGLVGYFNESEKSSTNLGPFYSSYVNSQSNDLKLIDGNYLKLTPYNNQTTDRETTTLLLIDPFSPIHAFTQILPIYKLQLPHEIVKNSIHQIQTFYRSGPLLVTTNLESKSIKIPHPGQGICSWLNPIKSSFNTQSFEELQITAPDMTATLEDAPYTATHGFFKLTPK